jgi:hypothetical protein
MFSYGVRLNENVIKHGAGADLLVHEIANRQAGIDGGVVVGALMCRRLLGGERHNGYFWRGGKM